MGFLTFHRLDGNILCLKQELITDFEQYKNHCSINCNGYNYLVKESVEEVATQCDTLLESHQVISRVAEPFQFPELKEKKVRKKKQ